MKYPNSSHGTHFDFVDSGAGPYLLLSIYQIEAVTPLEEKGGVSLQSISADGKRCVLYMSDHAARLLIQAPEIVSPERPKDFELSALDLNEMPEPIEFPCLIEFVSSVTHRSAKRLLCFLDEMRRHLCFLISSHAYLVLLNALRNLYPPSA